MHQMLACEVGQWRRGIARSLSKRVLGTACAAIALTACVYGVNAADASASEQPYGEVTRFGGVTGSFIGTPTTGEKGKFVWPVGFAVEPENPETHEKNAVYVLDQTWFYGEEGELDYRLQKFSASGTLLATKTFDDNFTPEPSNEHYEAAHPLVALAVDPANKRVYTIVESALEPEKTSNFGQYCGVAGRLEAWSTKTENETFGPADPAHPGDTDSVTGATIVAEEATLNATSKADALTSPQGIAVLPSGYVAIEAQEGVGAENCIGGQTVVQQVATSGAAKLGPSELLGKAPVAKEVQKEADWGGGVFAATGESEAGAVGVDFYTGYEKTPLLEKVNETFTNAEPLASVTLGNRDEAPTVEQEESVNYSDGGLAIEQPAPFAASSPVVQLTGNHLYASLYAQEGTREPGADHQAEITPWSEPPSLRPENFWLMGGAATTKSVGNMAVRLFEGDGNVVATIGGGAPNLTKGTKAASSELGSCNIDFRQAGLAAGSDGAVFVLTQPREGKYDGQVIEFAPGGQYKCPGMKEDATVESGELKAGKEEWKELQVGLGGGAPEVSVAPDEELKLSALSLDKPVEPVFEWTVKTLSFDKVYEWMPFAFEWNFEGATSGGPADDGYTTVNAMVAPEYKWPSPEAGYTYTLPGEYHASVRVHGSDGTKVVPFVVNVQGTVEQPLAVFSVPTSPIVAGKDVAFSAAESKVPKGTEVEYYEWNFEGKEPEVTTEEQVEHAFPTAGKYNVTLVIHVKKGAVRESKAAEHEVTVEAAQTTTSTTTNTTNTTTNTTNTSTSNTTTTTTTRTTSTASTKPAPIGKGPLTLKQKLEKALKVCRKDKSKKKRASCEKQARKKYAPSKKKKAKGKNSKK